MERRIGVRGIIYTDNKLLCVKLKDPRATRGMWIIPGGGLDSGEPLEAGLRREMIEETGITPEIGRLLFVQQFAGTNKQGEPREELEFFFHIINPADYKVIALSGTTHGEVELAAVEWIDPATATILPEFLTTIDLAEYTTTDKPVFMWNELEG